jgi:hypothetical protein
MLFGCVKRDAETPFFPPSFPFTPAPSRFFFSLPSETKPNWLVVVARCPRQPGLLASTLSFFLSINTFPTSNQLPRAQSAERPNPIILYTRNIYLALRASQTFAQFLPSSSPHALTRLATKHAAAACSPRWFGRPPSTTSQACWKRPSCLRIC